MSGNNSLDRLKGMAAGAAFALMAGSIALPSNAGAAEHSTEHMATQRMAYVSVGQITRAPIGWIQFCNERQRECKTGVAAPLDVQYTKTSFKELEHVNRYVNDKIKPMTDLEHYGVVEKWAYPDDGYGDCEDYVLLKRRMLMQLGWPRGALLVTVVRDKKGDGHAVLTVRTDKGEYVLDNQEDKILPWFETGYHFVKRQSQSDPNVWVSLGDTRPTTYVAAPR
jgi:predicted transglutaminase-like cysteine proteinase